MRRTLVTVVGSRKRVNLAVPSDAPISHLVDTLAQKCGEPLGGVTWALASSGSGTLPADRTLHDCGVNDGEVLYLASDGDAAIQANRFHSPRELTRALLPRKVPAWRRGLQAAQQAIAPNHVAAGEVNPARSPAPAALSAWQPDRAIDRGLRAWRATSYESLLEERIVEPRLRRCVTIAVMSPKGGVGKTTVSALVGTLVAQLRRDRVVAVDSNPDFGSLGRSLAPNHRNYVDDLVHLLSIPSLSVTSLDAHLGRAANGLMVVPAPTDPARMAALDENSYLQVIRRLQAMVGIIVLDCGTGLHEPPARAAAKAADQVILVTDSDPATASIVVDGARLLTQSPSRLILVVNKVPSGRVPVNVDLLGQYVPRARGLVIIPAHRRAAARVSMGTFRWQEAPRKWRTAVRELAAVLAADWAELGNSG